MYGKILQAIKSLGIDVIINENTNLVDTGILDSLKIMELIVELENIFCIEIDGEDIIPENFKTVITISNLVQKSGVKNE